MSQGPHSNIKYVGTTPGADTNTYVLLATILPAAPTNVMNAQWPQNFFGLNGINKVSVTLKCNQAGTINAYESTDRGVNWRQIDTNAVAAPASSAVVLLEYLVEGLLDFKLEWANGSSAQSPFDVLISLQDSRSTHL